MVRAPSREFEQFVRRVRRRFVVLRVVERVGLGVLFACGAAIPLLLIALWLGQPAAPLAPTALIVGALGGLVWGILTRPTPLEAAMEADRQLGWADLLGSALAVGDRSDDSWARAVTLAADERCRGTAARAVILNRLGARAWGGIGLAGALALIVGLMPSYSTLTQARENSHAPGSNVLSLRPDEQGSRFSARAPRRTVTQAEPEEASRDHVGEDTTGIDGSAANRTPVSQAQPHDSTGSPESRGAGSSHTDAKEPGALVQGKQNTGAASVNPQGVAGTGSGGRSPSSSDSAGSESGTASQESSAPAPPPWQSSDWPADVNRAHQEIETGQIPDAYRDVVRGYFDRR